jgi:hypothetical protein
MDRILIVLVLLWMGMISWFDIRKNEIPHSLWVILPLFGACVYRASLGDWRLVSFAVLVAAVSERERLSQLLQKKVIGKIVFWFPLIVFGLFLAIQFSPVAAFAILGFWAAWELKWWGGADAVAAITLIMIYPKVAFILTFLGVHVIAVFSLTISSLLKNKSIKLHKIPGLPLLFLAVLSFQVVQCFPL